jgi:PAS domain S-box-containing protein
MKSPMPGPGPIQPAGAALRIAFIYALFGVLWILFSDAALAAIVGNADLLTHLQSIKGVVYVVTTALLVYFLVRGYALAMRASSSRLLQSEAQYRRIVETANEGICTLDADARILLANARLASMVGYSPQELTGTWLLALLDPESQAVLTSRLSESDPAQVCDLRLRRRDGQEVWAIAVASPMTDEQERRVGSLLMLTDISERKRLESQLLQFQKMEAIGQLAGGVAHDFNNIVTAILGNVDLLRLHLRRRPIQAEELGGDVDQIERAGERAMALTRQLLTFSRRQVVKPELLDPVRLLADMQKMLERLIRDDVRLRITAGPDVPPILADAGQFEQVIINLVVNARDAMPEGGQVTVHTSRVDLDETYIAMQPEAHAGPHVLIAVSDTGTGMDAQTIQRIFEPFFTTKPAGKGTGLGLATVYGIVKQFGGHIRVYSEVGLGTTFKVYVPAAASGPVIGGEAPRETSEAGGNETIMVCEDEPSIRDLFRRVLEERGYRVLATDSPLTAIDISEKHAGPIELLITDVVMPDINGPQLSEHMRGARPRLKTLYVSGYTSDVVAEHGILSGEAEFLEKPFSAQVLTRRVREVLDHVPVLATGH